MVLRSAGLQTKVTIILSQTHLYKSANYIVKLQSPTECNHRSPKVAVVMRKSRKLKVVAVLTLLDMKSCIR